MNVALYFGSFNPIHTGHLVIANHILNETSADKLWFVVSPQNPLKENHALLNEYNRLHLVRIATEEDHRIRVSDIEFSLPKPSYTIDTLTYLKEKYPDYNFSVVLGSDSFQNISKWKNYQQILENYTIYIYLRPGHPVSEQENKHITILKAPMIEISATEIRKLIQQKKSIRYLVPDIVREEIERSGYYKK
ncbi:MAG: nicotinate-nucleotide adenylyltransferase [Bacteroidetes bacterium]|nr:nicotinate-nucleotide adenylyltransferase [Bacteroidota bacterium]